MDALEAKLGDRMWMSGSAPSQADVDALAVMGDMMAYPISHPNVYAWQCLVLKFNPTIRAAWPHPK